MFILQKPSSSLLGDGVSPSYRLVLAGHFSLSNPVHHILLFRICEMSAREAWPQCLPVLPPDSNGLCAFFLSREMHKWTFLTPQKEAGPLCVHTRAGCRSPEEADMLSAGGQRAGEPEQRGHHSVLGSSSSSTTHSHTHTHTHTHVCAPTPPHTHTHKWVKNTRMLFREGKSLNIYVKK